jgi:hypothetical protein
MFTAFIHFALIIDRISVNTPRRRLLCGLRALNWLGAVTGSSAGRVESSAYSLKAVQMPWTTGESR